MREEKPFRPFEILTAGGNSYEVRHPECLGQTPSGRIITIGLPDDSTVALDLLLVEGVRRNIKHGRNGSRRK